MCIVYVYMCIVYVCFRFKKWNCRIEYNSLSNYILTTLHPIHYPNHYTLHPLDEKGLRASFSQGNSVLSQTREKALLDFNKHKEPTMVKHLSRAFDDHGDGDGGPHTAIRGTAKAAKLDKLGKDQEVDRDRKKSSSNTNTKDNNNNTSNNTSTTTDIDDQSAPVDNPTGTLDI